MSEYSIRKIDSSAGITDVRYVEYTTILVPKSGGTFTGNVISPAFSATTYSGVTFYGDGTNLTGIASVTDFDSHTGDTTIHYTKGSINLSDLGSSAHTHPISEVVNLQSELDSKVNTYSTGGTYNSSTDIITITNSTGGTFDITGVSDTFVTGQTFNTGDYKLTTVLNDNTSFVSDLSILSSDMVVTGGTYDIDTGVVTFTNNSGNTFEVSGFTSGMTDSFTTTATLNGSTIEFANNIYGANYYNVDLNPLLSAKTDVSLFNTYTGDTATELASKALQTDFVTHSGDTSIHFTKESLNGIFVNKSGDTMTGGLGIETTLTVTGETQLKGTIRNTGNNLVFGNSLLPESDRSQNLGSSTKSWGNVFTEFLTIEDNSGADQVRITGPNQTITGDIAWQWELPHTGNTSGSLMGITSYGTGNGAEFKSTWYTLSGINLNVAVDTGGTITLSATTGGGTASGSGLTGTITVGENVSSGDLVYLNTDGKYWKADNTAEATSSTELRLVTETILADASGDALIRDSYTTAGLTAGDNYWVGTGGTITNVQPTDNATIVRFVGTALSTTKLEFNPDELFVEVTNLSGIVAPTEPTIRNLTGSTSLLATDYTANITATGNTTTTLPTAVGIAGRIYNIKNTGGGTMTIATTSSQTIDGNLTIVSTIQYESITVQSDGANWIII